MIMTVMIIHWHVVMPIVAVMTIHRWHHRINWIYNRITYNWICWHRHRAMIVVDHPIAVDIQLEERFFRGDRCVTWTVFSNEYSTVTENPCIDINTTAIENT